MEPANTSGAHWYRRSMAERPERTLSIDELAELADTDVGRVEEIRDAGLLTPNARGRYPVGDVHRLRIVGSFVSAGIPLEVLERATTTGAITFAYYDQLHARPGPLSHRTYSQVREALGARAALLGQVFAALGLAEPEPGSRLRLEDEQLLLSLLDIVGTSGAPDLALRVTRLLSDGLRRATEAVLSVYGDAVERLEGAVTGIPPRDVYERSLEPWSRYARLAPELGRWLTQRHLGNAIDAFSVEATEDYLAQHGLLPGHDKAPPAIAFVDLVGFTRRAAERGDKWAADLALAFADLAGSVTTRFNGRVVKLLGDGVLLQFRSPQLGIEAGLVLLSELRDKELGLGHAGLAFGPVVEHEGDIFGSTVNLASRIADVAGPGALLTMEDCAAHLDSSRFRVEPIGPVALPGFDEPVGLIRVSDAREERMDEQEPTESTGS
jgi:adenylate cyclase